ncbi:MAG TPA: hypothetical protein PLD47_14335, partial [Aggregatilineales bacterium]|nr:hypothetical protein [Aggregatilineales bacterium]
LWGFPQIAAPPRTGDPTSAAPETLRNEMLWSDGLRLLQGTLVDITCNVGTSGQRTFKVGGVEGVGTFFNVSQCQGEPETAGWFVGVSQYGRSYLFYAYIEPITAYNDARAALQAILDSVKFLPTAATKTPGTLLPTTTPLVTPTATPAG